MHPAHRPAPPWLLRLAYGGLAALLVGLAVLAAALAAGWADPPRAGPLRWDYDFKGSVAGWEFRPTAGASLAPRQGALLAEFSGAPAGAWAVGLAPQPPTGDFTLEVAGAAGANWATTPGSAGAYGLVFAWHDDTHYCALLINANGYAQAYRQAGAQRETWFAWQQWPHILLGTDNNRLRVDARGGTVTLRVNDEVVVAVGGVAAAGRVGVVAFAAPAAPTGAVVFSWARLWEPSTAP